ncbi:MAG: site-2 protease family protein [Deltaproteobacteria bacterium]|nr:site-2 protease family protein [Deltaproteobacteria bacterium]
MTHEQEQQERTIENMRRLMAQRDMAPAAEPQRDWSRWGWLGAAALFIFGKAQWLFALAKLAKLQTLLTMLLSIAVYAQVFGWPYAVGFVLLIFVHELGHAVALWQQGIPAGAPVFIPFVGAVIAMRGMPRDAWVEAVVGIGGPLLGTVGAIGCLIAAFVTSSPLMFALSAAGFLINLFNMIPISPLDGGRIVGVMSRWIWLVGYIVGGAMFLLTYSPMLLLILILGLFQLPSLFAPRREGYYDVSMGKRVVMGVAYFGLLAVLAAGAAISEAFTAELGQPQRLAVLFSSALVTLAGRGSR